MGRALPAAPLTEDAGVTPRERCLQTLAFGRPDRIPLQPGAGRKSTLETWRGQGLPPDVEDYNEYAYRLASGTLPRVRAPVRS